jgi:tetratricopeptide (TPR) repeat protein
VHRDVKPANILIVSESGRAKITDFGLARMMAAPSDITRDGVVAGTPAYMSPEQARYEPDLDSRSDVYSLGASFYEGLTGQPPFAGALHAILRRIIEEDPILPRRFDQGIAADLETICLKAMAKEPARRYQSAREIGDDLTRSLRDEPIAARPETRMERASRWCRRNPRVISLSAALALAVVAGFLLVAWQWRRAERQAQRAERLRQDAEANLNSARANLARARRAVDQFYTRFYEKGVLEVPGIEKVRHEVLGEMFAYYKDFLEQHRDDPGLRRELAETCQRLGSITVEQGTKTDGLALLRRGARDFELLLRESPGDRDLQDRLLVCWNDTGRLETELGERETARKTYQKAIDLLTELIAASPSDLQHRRTLAAVHGNLARLAIFLGETANARSSYMKALELQKELARQAPDDLFFKNILAQTYHNLTFVSDDAGERRRLCVQAIAIRKEPVEQQPTQVMFRRNLARTYEVKGMNDFENGRPTEGLKSVQAGCDILRQAVADQPPATEYQANLGQALDNLGTSLASSGRRQEGRAAIAEAAGIFRKLVHANPNDAGFRAGLEVAEKNLATIDNENPTFAAVTSEHDSNQVADTSRKEATKP